MPGLCHRKASWAESLAAEAAALRAGPTLTVLACCLGCLPVFPLSASPLLLGRSQYLIQEQMLDHNHLLNESVPSAKCPFKLAVNALFFLASVKKPVDSRLHASSTCF